ncbi:hypothetical protein [Oryzibacter oryziterrae]|uniref:hypothetical protein n=1 Tax=Oryzibacter oryziterrae TaxID=2766474 RepID=UPI001F2B0525|nr:hypothetical protein [Oryzibacter oryziterrae]
MTSRVFVPLVGADGSGQQLFEAIAGDTPPEEHPAKLVAQISELYDFGLYRIGQTVREAVFRFAGTRLDRVWLGRRNARLKPWYLRISELQVGRLSDENAKSAGLGLAVSALLETFGRPHGPVFATGEIALTQSPDGVGTVSVAAVDGIRGKLGLIGDYLLQHRAQLAGMKILVLLPLLAVDGRPLAEAEARTLLRLKEAAAGLDLAIHHLGTLDEIEPLLGPFSAEPFLSRRKAGWLAAAAFAVLATATAWYLEITAPVELTWVPVDKTAAASHENAAPRRAHYSAGADKFELLPTCYDSQRQPVVVGGETLVLRVEARDGRPFASLLAPPRFFIASVSRAADPVVLDASQFKTSGDTVAPGVLTEAIAALPIEATEDEIRLFVVATRNQTVSLSDLTGELRDRLKGLTGAAVLTTSSQFLKDRFDGQIDYQFKVTLDAKSCS